jgi:hypothetical protein
MLPGGPSHHLPLIERYCPHEHLAAEHFRCPKVIFIAQGNGCTKGYAEILLLNLFTFGLSSSQSHRPRSRRWMQKHQSLQDISSMQKINQQTLATRKCKTAVGWFIEDHLARLPPFRKMLVVSNTLR